MPIELGYGGGIVGVEHLEPLVEDFGAEVAHLFVELLAHFGIGGGAGGRAVEEGMDVKTGAADDEGDVFAAADVLKGVLGVLVEFSYVEGVVDVADVDEVVGNEGPLVGGRFGRSDVHAAIDLHRVGGDDLAAHGCSEGERQLRFARSCRPRDDEHPLLLPRGKNFLLLRDWMTR